MAGKKGKSGEEHWNAKWRREKNYRTAAGLETCGTCRSCLKSGRCSVNHNARVSVLKICDDHGK